MAALNVVASRPLAGKTAVATGLARLLAANGPVTLARLGSGPAAEADAATYGAFIFASTPGVPVTSAPQAPGSVLVEAAAGDVPQEGAVVLVVRGEMTEADTALVAGLGDRLAGTIAVNVPPSNVEAVARDLTNAGLRPLALLAEDRSLAAPSVGEIRDILGAQVLYEGENEQDVVEDVLLSPVYADPARPHFHRFHSKAILAPFNKTDLHLAAIEARAACLVLTGGRSPSPYVVDRAQGESTTVMLAPGETPETLSALSDVWLTSRFRGESKATVIHSLLEAQLDLGALRRRIG